VSSRDISTSSTTVIYQSQRNGQLLMTLEQERHPLGFGLEGGFAVTARLVSLMCLDQFRRHIQGIVR
jgi:hypothetical protein